MAHNFAYALGSLRAVCALVLLHALGIEDHLIFPVRGLFLILIRIYLRHFTILG